MTTKPPRKVTDVLPQLSDDLYTYGIRDVVIESLNEAGEPCMRFANDYLRLSPQLKDQLFKAEGVQRRKRDFLEFIQLLVRELGDALEILPEDEQDEQDQNEDHDNWHSMKPPNPSTGISVNQPAKHQDQKQPAKAPSSNSPPTNGNSGLSTGKPDINPPLRQQPDSDTAHNNNSNGHSSLPSSPPVNGLTVKEHYPESPPPSLNPSRYSPTLQKDSQPPPSFSPTGNKHPPPNNPESVAALGIPRGSPQPVLNPEKQKETSSGISPGLPKESNIAPPALNPNMTKPSPLNPKGIEPTPGLNNKGSKTLPASNPNSPPLDLKPTSAEPSSSGLNGYPRKPPPLSHATPSPSLNSNTTKLPLPNIPDQPPPSTLDAKVDVLEPQKKPKKTWTGLSDPSQNPDPKTPSNSPKKPEVQLRTAEEYYEYLKYFIDKNLGPFEFDEVMTKDLATRAMQVAKQIKDDYELSDEEVGKMARLSLFDIFILCDNSGSMKFGNRVETLNKTLQGVAHWATRIEKDGISLRFLNRVKDGDGRFDNLTDLHKIDDLICSIPTKGNTRLGNTLAGKVIQPLLQRADNRAQQARDGVKRSQQVCIKPRIIFIITDGQPEGEPKNCLRDQILEAKMGRLGTAYGSAATIFIIARVGQDNSAIEFIESLSEDERISGLILSAADRLEDVIEKLIGDEESEKDRNAYERYLIKMFLCAVDCQTNL
ncbi:uncharacterized protein N7496_001709 [Penicillium cataractarum]|uniref:VWFA domain-containing protein n=1 Tax=Penicillium cataractarum TaxID=2100454 RepID=A0A9W9VWG6_9EURO|nr:uncharacterized protein N7496_001709 [Penicillium cataractarum]KAJ5390641.1 hypothetical protein N7496_001709 [Penicillium cataractarum]